MKNFVNKNGMNSIKTKSNLNVNLYAESEPKLRKKLFERVARWWWNLLLAIQCTPRFRFCSPRLHIFFRASVSKTFNQLHGFFKELNFCESLKASTLQASRSSSSYQSRGSLKGALCVLLQVAAILILLSCRFIALFYLPR